MMKIRCQVTSLVDSYLAFSLTGLAGEHIQKYFLFAFLLERTIAMRISGQDIIILKPTFMISNLLMATGGLLAAFAPEFFTFVACRVLAGFAIAGVEVNHDDDSDDNANSDDYSNDNDEDENDDDDNDDYCDSGDYDEDGYVFGVLFCDVLS